MSDFDSLLEGIAEPEREILEHFLTTLSQTIDPTLTVLRSHLLLEELLWRGIAAAVPYPEHLDSLRLNFARLISLFKALYGDGGNDKQRTWTFLSRLNTLRNNLAHNIDVPQLEATMDELTASMAVSVSTRREPTHRRAYLFTLAVGFVGGQVGSVLRSPNR